MSFPKTATLSPVPFRISTPQADLDDLKTLLRLSPLPPPTYEGTQRQFGVTSKWMAETKTYWETQFDWRAHEAEINKHAQYTVAVSAGAGAPPQTLHFLAHVSADAAAVPLLLLHGWPGSFVEFLGLVDALAASTGPAFTVIVPSLPGYAFSEGPPVDRDFEMAEAAALVNALMVGLGYGAQSGGYVAQGGDIGSFLATRLQQSYEDCRAIHLNALFTAATHPTDNLTPTDLAGLARANTFRATGMAYAHEHATRPSTIGHVLSSSPVALLAWVGEKLLEWTDADPDVETVLRLVSLWWFTQTAPRAVYPYREMLKPPGAEKTVWRRPVGYSLFPAEIVPTPRAWAELETEGRMVWFREHEAGGHFAAMEKPQVLARDLAEFVVFLGGLGS